MLALALSVPGNGIYAAWDGYVEKEIEGPKTYTLFDFDSKAEVINAGGRADGVHTKGHRYAIGWDNMSNPNEIRFPAAGLPEDWSEYESIGMWVYSEKASQDQFMVIVETYPDSNNYKYFSSILTLDWEGWQQIHIPFHTMVAARGPDWSRVTGMRIVTTGWDLNPNGTTGSISIADCWIAAGDGSSLQALYSAQQLEDAKAAISGGLAVYQGSPNVVTTDFEVKNLVAEDTAITAKWADGTTLVPLSFFQDHMHAADASESDGLYRIVIDNTVISGKAGEDIYKIGDEQKRFAVVPQIIDRRLYLPLAEVAEAFGWTAVSDRGMVAISPNEAIKALERPNGVNECNEIIAYLAARKAIRVEALTKEDCAAVRERWLDRLLGSKETNDTTDETIANAIARINASGANSWKQLMKKQGQTELFSTITTTDTASMTATYAALWNMARAYGTPGAELYQNKALAEDILYGLEWMYQNRYGKKELTGEGWLSTSQGNWWEWQVGSPRHLIHIMMVMDRDGLLDEIQKKDYLALFDTLVSGPVDTAVNAVHTAQLAIGSALLQNNPKKVFQVQAALEAINLYADNDRNQLSRLNGDRKNYTRDMGQGFFTDGSYILHTLHPMNGTYGVSHIEAMTEFYAIFAGTAFEVTVPSADYIAEWIYNAFDPLLYQGAFFRMVKGRVPLGQQGTGTSVLIAMLDALDFLKPEDQDAFQAIMKAQIRDSGAGIDFVKNNSQQFTVPQLVKLTEILEDASIEPRDALLTNHVYHNEDKVAHQRGNFALGVSMSSSRIFNYESINSQNMDGWYLSDGMTEYYTKGNYRQATDTYWANVNPYRLPGTTVDTQVRKEVSIHQGNEYLSSKDFVGAASNGEFGTAAMWLESYHNKKDFGEDGGSYGGLAPAHDCNLTAKKAWFMFDDEVVCLGTDIHASNDADVLTIVDNKLANRTKSLSDDVPFVPYEIKGVEASDTPEAENVAANTLDGSFSTKWAAEKDATITWDLGEAKKLGFIGLSFQNGGRRTQQFILETSADKKTWTETFHGASSGKSEAAEGFDLKGTTGRYVRFTNLGNSGGSTWVSLTTATIYPPTPDGSFQLPEPNIIGIDTFTADGVERSLSEEENLSGIRWAHMDGVGGYYFPTREGKLSARYTRGENSFMELWFCHGKNPDGGSYAYTLLPGKTAEETANYAGNPDIEILANTPALQVVREKRLHLTCMVFWEAGSYGAVTVDKPMIVMLQEQDGVVTVSISDPTQKLTEGTVWISRPMTVGKKDDKMTIKNGDAVQITMDFVKSDGRTMEAKFVCDDKP